MPNPNHDPENGQFTEPPDPWDELKAAGYDPNELKQAGQVWRGLNHLDSRQETLRGLIRPDIDTWVGQPQQPEKEQPDHFAQYQQQPEPEEEYYTPPAQPQVDMHAFANEVYQRAVADARQGVITYADLERMQQEQARDQAFTSAASAATEQYHLPDFMAGDLEQQAKAMSAQQPNRPPGDIANELARQRREQMDAYFAAQNPTLPGPSTPGGPVPSATEAGPPQGTDPDAWAMERSREGLG